MKRFILGTLALAGVAALLVGCGNGGDGTRVIGFSQCNSAEPWREAMNKELEAAAKKYDDVDLRIVDAQQDNSKQVADVENFITMEVDVLIISPNEAKPLTAVVERAYDAGIPVIVLDRKIASDKFTTYIGADNELIGEAAGKYAAEALGGKGKVVEIWGLKGSTPAQERHDGFMRGIAEYPEIDIIYEQDGAWLRQRGKEIMENALQRFEEIDLAYGHNDPMAFGARIAAEEANRAGDMIFVGIDGLPGAEGGAQAVADGMLDATFVYPTGGEKAIEIARDILAGKDVPKSVTLETARVDSTNADQYK
ncbi:MAG: substrate-binding domain-containing protein [Ignavibacteriales bacterium]|nr:substrate-binding domain-containing protein [Ignavibacteriales bacterium]